MSIRSMFIVITTLAFCLTACRYWNAGCYPVGYDLVGNDLHAIDRLMALVVLFEVVWSSVNFLGIRECNRITDDGHYSGATAALFEVVGVVKTEKEVA